MKKLLAEKDYAGLTALAEERGQGETFDEAGRNIVQEIEDTTKHEGDRSPLE